jgi:two-component system sensor kinase FixL
VADRLFDPFVSTNSAGMGLGLSICHTIVTGHGGRIWAEPSRFGGTAFHFTLLDAGGGMDAPE